MTISEDPHSVERFRTTVWQFQETFQTPLQDLPSFAAAILSAHEPIQGGRVTIDQVVFEPNHLTGVLAKHALTSRFGHGCSIEVAGLHEVESLLHAAFSDWIDFIFIPSPAPFVLYADHDEYTTFYANVKTNLDRVVESLLARDFVKVSDYERRL